MAPSSRRCLPGAGHWWCLGCWPSFPRCSRWMASRAPRAKLAGRLLPAGLPMSFEIRRATFHDLDALVPLFDGYRQFYGKPSDEAGAREFLTARLRLNESMILLARDEHGAAAG